MTAGSCTRIAFLTTATFTAALLLVATTEAQAPRYRICADATDTYPTNSTYRANLLVALDSLTSTANTTAAEGFSTNFTGEVPDRVYGLALCRGDVRPANCGICLQNAATNIQQICPFRRSGMAWYDDCFLRYSNQRFLNAVDDRRVFLWNPANITQGASQFNAAVWSALQELAQHVARNSSTRPPMFAAGQMALRRDDYQTLYGLVQCTRDLSADDCNSCLSEIISNLPRCCQGRPGGRVLTGSCNFRYEVYPFFNWSAALALPSTNNTTNTNTTTTNTNTTEVVGSDLSGKKKNASIVAVTIPLAVAFSLLILIGCICFQKHRTTKKKIDVEKRQEISTESPFFDLSAIKRATDNFSQGNKLGEGGFGAVFKGLLANRQEIAVKRLSRSSGQGVKELKNEVTLLVKLQHRNLVRLLGHCLDHEEKLLVYEYVANKSLDTFLYDPAKKEELNWERRYNIINGIARGLLYLHEESQVKIIHRDLKTSNILLDADLNPKISDFGLARLFGGDQTQECTSRVVGTLGYMSPEYVRTGRFSSKSDVFSFGVLVLEIVTGQRRTVPLSGIEDLLTYVWDHWSNGLASDILDPSLEGNFQLSEAMRCIEIGLQCVQESPSDRPTMSNVVLQLSSYSISTRVPTRPVFLIGYSKDLTFEQPASSDRSASLPDTFGTQTPNEMSITELDGR